MLEDIACPECGGVKRGTHSNVIGLPALCTCSATPPMQLVGSDYVDDEEREVQRVLSEHPDVKRRITLLLNSFRETLMTAMEISRDGGVDMADIQISLAKKDAVMQSLGIRVLKTMADWMEVRES